MIQDTSISAYNGIKDKLGEKQFKIYEMLKSLEYANNMILAKKLGWDINRVTPRVLELRKMGLIVPECIRMCPITKRMTWFWKVNNQTFERRTLENG